MNSDSAYARVRIRQAWPLLAELGLVPERIASGARHLSRARDALEACTAEFLASASRIDASSAILDAGQLSEAPAEIALRALACLLMRVSGQVYRPRFERLASLCESIRNGKFDAARTLHGCRISRAGKDAAVFGTGTIVIESEAPRRTARDIAQRGEIS
jgi:tRNA(Ile)-lysidine synthase